MADRIADYKQVKEAAPDHNEVWPLYGAGFENLGQNQHQIEVDLPHIGPDELLVRHDACGLCFSDIKVLNLGEEHPRIYRDMKQDPVVLGHEVSMTIVDVGENLRDQYQPGDRYIIQADIWVGGVGYAYGYEIQGGLSKYGKIDQRVLNGDHGNYLIPVQATTGYAESALTEPWACVIAAYQLEYRTGIKDGGTAWIVGTPAGEQDYSISAGFDQESHPSKLLLTNVPANFRDWLVARAAELGIEIIEASDPAQPPVEQVDDIIVLGADPDVIETVSPFLADYGIVAVIAEDAPERSVALDMGRIHYNRWVYVGGSDPDIARAYSDVPVRSSLRPGGRALFVGAGGPMGRMHVQRAIQIADGPAVVVCTDVSDLRINDLYESFAEEARAKGVEFVCLNPMERDSYEQGMARFREHGFDDVIVMAPVPRVIEDAATMLAPKGVMNVFAGVARGTMTNLSIGDVIQRDVRYIGHSASTIDDLRLMLSQAESGELSPNRAVAAVGSLSAVYDGLKAVHEATFPGKVVIFPHIREMPLTALPDLKDTLPTVYEKLKDGREWTVEAEQEFLRLMLP